MQAKLTPLMQQYWDIKSEHPDKVVLFRMGDFFEMFHQDAELAAPILGITLTQRNKKDADSAKMCGVPHHSIAIPIAKLLRQGLKVAICDQIEDPALAKGIVKRAVTRVLTPGMVYDPDTLDQLSANYLSAYDDHHLAYVDITTGEAFYYDFADVAEREEILALMVPAELVLSRKQMQEREASACVSTVGTISEFEGESGGGSPSSSISSLSAVERLKLYIVKMQGEETCKILTPFEARRRQTQLRLSATAIRHLEIFENSRGGREGSLFAAVDRTQTSAGARALRSWLMTPLVSSEELDLRYGEIQMWLGASGLLKNFRQQLALLGDVERRLGKVHSTTFNARDLLAIAQSILIGEKLTQMHPSQAPIAGLEVCVELGLQIERTLNDELPLAVKEGGMIRPGVVAYLD